MKLRFPVTSPVFGKKYSQHFVYKRRQSIMNKQHTVVITQLPFLFRVGVGSRGAQSHCNVGTLV